MAPSRRSAAPAPLAVFVVLGIGVGLLLGYVFMGTIHKVRPTILSYILLCEVTASTHKDGAAAFTP